MLPRMFNTLAIATMFLAVMASSAYADYLGDITVSKSSPASLPLNWTIEVACDYEWTGGVGKDDPEVYINAIPLTNGSITPGTTYEGAGPYEPGYGRVWPTFTIQSGDVVVDEIQLTMKLAPPEFGTVLEVIIPVDLHFGPHSFQGMTYDFESPERMQFGQFVNIDFIWRTTHVGGHRIVIRPLTGGDYTPNLVTGGSAVITGNSGAVTRYFSVLQDEADFAEVDGIVFEIYNADWSVLLYEFIVPVSYHFGTTAVQNIVLSPDTPASLIHGENVTITFDYLTDHPMDPMMFVYPQSGGVNSPDFLLNPPYPLAPVFGSGENTFTIFAVAGLVDVDELRFIMFDYFNQEIIIDQFTIPVYYHFSGHSIRDVQYDPKPPAILSIGTYMNFEITCDNGFSEEGWILTQPLSWGIPTPNVDGDFRSVALPGANPPTTQYFTVTEGEKLVDQIHFEMFNIPEDWLWLSYYQDVWFYFGSSAAVAPVIEVPGVVAPFLHDCYPNPFNPRTTIKFDLPAAMVAGVKIYDLRGRLVKTLVGSQVMAAGANQAVWDGKDDAGQGVAAGVYLYRLEAGDISVSKRMTLVK